MAKLRWVCTLIGLSLLMACCQAQSTNRSAATLTAIPATASASPSAAPASPSPLAAGTVMVGLSGVQANITLVHTDGSVVASVAGVPVGDEHAIGAYLVAANDGTKEWTVDQSGVIREIAPAAAKLLAPGTGSLMVLSSTTAIIGCSQAPNGDCTADAIDLVTGAVRPLLTVAGTPPTMRYGSSLTVMDVSTDLNTVWFREVTGATTPTLSLVAVDLSTGNTARHVLPGAMLDEQDLAISRDGLWVAGQEAAGTDSTNLAVRHLHVVSVATGIDEDVQGNAVYVGGLRTPSVLFAPDSSRVAWWGGVNNGSSPQRVNIALVGGTGKTVYPPDASGDVNGINGVFWLDGSTLVVVHSGLMAVNADTGASDSLHGGIDSLLGVLLPVAK